jgi:hypothetical protein
MSNTAPDSIKRYSAAKERFFKPVIVNFFASEFPRLFGPIMREKLADELIRLFETLSPETTRIKPGQILWNALHKRTRGDSPNRKYVTVVLSLITEDDITQLTNGVPMSHITKKAIARIIREAYAQGGILSSRDIGLLTLRHPTFVSKIRKEYENEHNCTLPHTGVLHDMGSCISHKATVIRKVILEKKDPTDVAKECNHTQRAIDNYLKDYQRVKTVYQQNQDIDYIHIVTGIAKHVVKQYVEFINHDNF